MMDAPPPADTPAESLLDIDLRPSLGGSALGVGLVAGLVAAVLPFLVTVASTSVTYEDGRITSASYRDNLAVACGAVALAIGALALISWLRGPRAVRTIALAVALL